MLPSDLDGPEAYLVRRERRAAIRQAELAALPPWYSPALHFLCTNAVAVGVAVFCLRGVSAGAGWAWATLPATFVVMNGLEWWFHKELLHRRRPPFAGLYRRHTPSHHMYYVDDDMALSSFREVRLVLFPWWAGVLGAPAIGALLWLGIPWWGWDRALLVEAGVMLYFVAYEWLHLLYHLRADRFPGNLSVVRWLARHHELHHDPRLMQRHNFNVNVPLFDWLKIGRAHV